MRRMAVVLFLSINHKSSFILETAGFIQSGFRTKRSVDPRWCRMRVIHNILIYYHQYVVTVVLVEYQHLSWV